MCTGSELQHHTHSAKAMAEPHAPLAVCSVILDYECVVNSETLQLPIQGVLHPINLLQRQPIAAHLRLGDGISELICEQAVQALLHLCVEPTEHLHHHSKVRRLFQCHSWSPLHYLAVYLCVSLRICLAICLWHWPVSTLLKLFLCPSLHRCLSDLFE